MDLNIYDEKFISRYIEGLIPCAKLNLPWLIPKWGWMRRIGSCGHSLNYIDWFEAVMYKTVHGTETIGWPSFPKGVKNLYENKVYQYLESHYYLAFIELFYKTSAHLNLKNYLSKLMNKVHGLIKENYANFSTHGYVNKKYIAFFLTHREMLDLTLITFPG